ncbi:fungal zn(2)-Cys(6) binuclear cluster domain-containing protein [Sarocladium implicatum]|nr:fungal zn(2)-Cys(6) binuclear cluster domain-containing protein [Sarocladium implicatum]
MPPTRGKAACLDCRSRKQKCDEERPTCGRCRSLNRQCRWPKLNKRGPVKGYTESLEHRLEEAESALYKILAVTEYALLDQAFEADIPNLSSLQHFRNLNTGEAGSRPDANKADLIAHWEAFPLTNTRDVRRWAADIKSRSSEWADGAESRVRLSRTRLRDVGPSTGNIETEDSPGASEARAPTAEDSSSARSHHQEPGSASSISSGNLAMSGDNGHGLNTAQAADSAQGTQQSGLNLPVEFQRQFVW